MYWDENERSSGPAWETELGSNPSVLLFLAGDYRGAFRLGTPVFEAIESGIAVVSPGFSAQPTQLSSHDLMAEPSSSDKLA
jgi:hypothetical protein